MNKIVWSAQIDRFNFGVIAPRHQYRTVGFYFGNREDHTAFCVHLWFLDILIVYLKSETAKVADTTKGE